MIDIAANLLFAVFLAIQVAAIGVAIVKMCKAQSTRERVERGVDLVLFSSCLIVAVFLLSRLQWW